MPLTALPSEELPLFLTEEDWAELCEPDCLAGLEAPEERLTWDEEELDDLLTEDEEGLELEDLLTEDEEELEPDGLLTEED